MSSVARSILGTLALAETFGMPLTAFEAWKWLLRDPDSIFQVPNSHMSLRNVLVELTALERAGVLAQQDGYYTFPDSRELVEERLWRLAIASTKLVRAKRWASWIARTPYIHGVFAYGSLATGNTREESDLDVSWPRFSLKCLGFDVRAEKCAIGFVSIITLRHPHLLFRTVAP